jgi:Na+/H+-dicarboxylate symporter
MMYLFNKLIIWLLLAFLLGLVLGLFSKKRGD